MVSDRSLIADARRGMAPALASLYEEYAGELLRLAAQFTGSQDEAEDLLHDLFVGLPELLARYEHRDKLGPWLRGVITRMALARVRSASRRNRVPESLISEIDRAHHTDPWNAIDLERAIASLPADAREIFVLRQIEGYSHDDIASLLGIRSGAARVRYLRAIRQLRALLEPRK